MVLTEDSRATDFRLGLLVLIVISMASLRQLSWAFLRDQLTLCYAQQRLN